jgi:hypothetical protein
VSRADEVGGSSTRPGGGRGEAEARVRAIAEEKLTGATRCGQRLYGGESADVSAAVRFVGAIMCCIV